MQCKLLILQTARQFPGPDWLNYDIAFRKDTAASSLAGWSRMKVDLHNSHNRSTAITHSSPCTTSTLTSLSQSVFYPSACQSQFNTAILGMTVHVAGLLVDANTVMPVSVVITLKLVVPFKSVKRFSNPGPLLRLDTNATDVESLGAMTTAAVSCVNSVQNVFLFFFRCLRSSMLQIVLLGSRELCLPFHCH